VEASADRVVTVAWEAHHAKLLVRRADDVDARPHLLGPPLTRAVHARFRVRRADDLDAGETSRTAPVSTARPRSDFSGTQTSPRPVEIITSTAAFLVGESERA
jgi:hypothetical protein